MAGEIPASKWEFPEIDRFGPFWSVLGCFGQFWENPRLSLRLRGHIPASSAAQGSCQRFTSLSRLVRKRTKNGKIQNGPVWDRLGPFGPVWARGPYAPVCYAPVSGLLITAIQQIMITQKSATVARILRALKLHGAQT